MANNFASFFVALTLGVLYGATLNASAPVITEEPWDAATIGAGMTGLITVSLSIGATIGSFFGGFISDRVGPKKTLAGGILICFVCVVWIWTQTQNIALLIVLRVFNGLGIGVATSIGPQYIGEQASAERRGMLGTMFQLFVCTGQLIAFAIGLGLHGVKDSWRYNFLLTGVWALIFLIGVFCLPESAGYVLAQAKKTQARLSGSSGINADVEQQQDQSSPSLWDDVKSVFVAALTSKRAFVTGVVLAAFQQITGINIFMLYSGSIFEQVGWTGTLNRVATVVMGAWNLIVVIVAIFLVDNLGRKPLLIGGFSLMLVGTVMIAILGFLKTDNKGLMIGLTVPAVALFLLGFQMGPGPMYYVTVAELYDRDIRGRAMGAINAINWLSNIFVSQLFPILFESMGMVVFIIFAILSFIVVVFIILFVSEMKGTVLEGQEADPSETQPLRAENQNQDGYSG